MSLNQFLILSKLGEGTYSSVYRVKRLQDGKEYAMKQVNLRNISEKEKENALNEIRILANLHHPNIISYKEAFLDAQSNTLCLVLEYADDGDLSQKIFQQKKRNMYFKESDILHIFFQVVEALKGLHNRNIVHRDLKSANIFLFKNGVVKLGDMNVSKIAKIGMLYTQTGTPYYASPEVWRDKPYDIKSDIWSLGCVLYEIISLKPPFEAENMQGLFKKVIKGIYQKIPVIYSQELNDLVRQMLQIQPFLRPNCNMILHHPIFISYNEVPSMEREQNHKLMQVMKLPKKILAKQSQPPSSYEETYSLILKKKYQQETDQSNYVDSVQDIASQISIQKQRKKLRNVQSLHDSPQQQYYDDQSLFHGIFQINRGSRGSYQLEPLHQQRSSEAKIIDFQSKAIKNLVPQNISHSYNPQLQPKSDQQIQGRNNRYSDKYNSHVVDINQSIKDQQGVSDSRKRLPNLNINSFGPPETEQDSQQRYYLAKRNQSRIRQKSYRVNSMYDQSQNQLLPLILRKRKIQI